MTGGPTWERQLPLLSSVVTRPTNLSGDKNDAFTVCAGSLRTWQDSERHSKTMDLQSSTLEPIIKCRRDLYDGLKCLSPLNNLRAGASIKDNPFPLTEA